MTRCPYCQSGRIAVEPGTSLTYPCPDCGGTGRSSFGDSDTVDPRDCDDPDFEPNDSETKGPQ